MKKRNIFSQLRKRDRNAEITQEKLDIGQALEKYGESLAQITEDLTMILRHIRNLNNEKI